MSGDKAKVFEQLAEDITAFTLDPYGFTKYAFPWGDEELVGEDGPWKWQTEILEYIKEHLNNPATRFQPCMIAVSSGHGIGKTALISWVLDWGLSTCDDAKAVVTANTEPQLRTKTWPEVAKWFRNTINKHWFNFEETSIQVKAPGHQRTWRADRITWSEQNTEAFAGLHNKGKRIILIFDEASAIAPKVWEVAEGALTDKDTEIIWLVFGNPTQPSGVFRECFGAQKHRWKTYQIDSRTVEGTNKELLNKLVEDYGEDSDRVRVRVRGEFPRASANSLIPGEDISFCRKFKAQDYDHLPKVLGVDVARFGDDQTVIFLRQGRYAECLGKWRGKDTAQVAALVAEQINAHDPKAVVIDSDGIGAPVFDQLKFLGYGRLLTDFHGGKPANKAEMYSNRRTEVWSLMGEAMKAGMEIPDDPELGADLAGPEYDFSPKQQVRLEKKDEMKMRGLASPDMADALAYTFAVQLSQPSKERELRGPRFIEIGAEPSLAWMR